MTAFIDGGPIQDFPGQLAKSVYCDYLNWQDPSYDFLDRAIDLVVASDIVSIPSFGLDNACLRHHHCLGL